MNQGHHWRSHVLMINIDVQVIQGGCNVVILFSISSVIYHIMIFLNTSLLMFNGSLCSTGNPLIWDPVPGACSELLLASWRCQPSLLWDFHRHPSVLCRRKPVSGRLLFVPRQRADQRNWQGCGSHVANRHPACPHACYFQGHSSQQPTQLPQYDHYSEMHLDLLYYKPFIFQLNCNILGSALWECVLYGIHFR